MNTYGYGVILHSLDFEKNLQKVWWFRMFGGAAAMVAYLTGTPVGAVVDAQRPQDVYFDDILAFKSSLTLNVQARPERVVLGDSQIQARLEKAKKGEKYVESFQLTINDDIKSIKEVVQQLARPQNRLELTNFLVSEMPHAETIKAGSKLKSLNITSEAYHFMDSNKVEEMFAKTHQNVTVQTLALREEPKLRQELLDQLTPFFSSESRRAVAHKIALGAPLHVDSDLLPSFARKMVKKHTIYKGPNCFHAALAFQSPTFTRSSLVNIREEVGYHRSMINYDELWRILNKSFYEVNPTQAPLKYGDMIVFFEVSNHEGKSGVPAVDFHAMRHAATYLFDGYVFSKGSKSANTPYLVKTLGEEWDLWRQYTHKLGLKVFRRNVKNVSKVPPEDLADWIY